MSAQPGAMKCHGRAAKAVLLRLKDELIRDCFFCDSATHM